VQHPYNCFYQTQKLKIMSHLLIPNAEQILRENYNQSDAEVQKSMEFADWVKNESEQDPGFFSFILKSENINDYGSGMSDEEKNAVKYFINSL